MLSKLKMCLTRSSTRLQQIEEDSKLFKRMLFNKIFPSYYYLVIDRGKSPQKNKITSKSLQNTIFEQFLYLLFPSVVISKNQQNVSTG